MNKVVKGILAMGTAFMVVAVVKDHIAFVHSTTNSAPYKYFLMMKTLSPGKGDYTCLESAWYGGRVIKKVIGLPGDLVTYDTSGVLSVGAMVIGKPHTHSSDGRPLTPVQSGEIPEGYVFLRGDHDRSFDSRYQEMGLVPQSKLEGKAIGLV